MSFRDEEIRATGLANLGWWHHSVHNTLDKVDRSLLLPHLRVYARWMWDLLTAPILPYEFAALRWQDRRASRCAGRDRCTGHRHGWRRRTREGVPGSREPAGCARCILARRTRHRADGAEADTVNRTLLELARHSFPSHQPPSAPYGQDRYGHSWQPELIPRWCRYTRLAVYDRDSEAFQTWWVAQIRTRNRVVDALDQASAIVRTALSELNERPV